MRKSLLTVIAGVLCCASIVMSCRVGLGDAVDTEAPKIEITYPPISSVIKDKFVLAGTYSDDQGVTRIAVQLKNSSKDVVLKEDATVDVQNGMWKIDIEGTKYTDGDYSVDVVAFDDAGHKSGIATTSFAIDNHAPVLLMDEPFSAVDMQNRQRLQEQLIDVRSRFDTTILFITHDVDEAIYLADRVVVMDRNPGRIKEIVEVDLPHPRNRNSDEFFKLQDKVEELLGVWED